MSPKSKWPLKTLIEVEWVDIASHNNGWMTIEETLKTIHPALCRTVGYLIGSDKLNIRLAMLQTIEDNSIGMTMVIPKGCILKIRKIKFLEALQ